MNKLSGAAFRAEVRQLQKQVSRLSAELAEKQQQWEWQHEREQVLLDLAAHQELILSTLYRFDAFDKGKFGNTQLHGLGEGAAAPQQLRLPALARGTGANGSGSSSGSRPLWSTHNAPEAPGISSSSASSSNIGPFPASYVADMLRSTTPAQARNIRSLTPDQCRQRFSSIFSHLVVLTEMVSRQQQQEQQQQGTATAAPALNSAAAAAAAEPQQTVGAQIDSATKAAAAAEAIAAAGIPPARANSSRSTSKPPSSPTSTSPAAEYGKDPAKDLQALEQLVDEFVRFSVLGMVYNWLPFYQVGLVQHLASGLAPAGHYMRVAKRLQLSNQQILHLKIAVNEYNRLCKSARAATADLLTESGRLVEALALYKAAEEKMLRTSAVSAAAAGTADYSSVGAQITGAQAAAAAAANQRFSGSSALSNVLQISNRLDSYRSEHKTPSSTSAPNATTYRMYSGASTAAAAGATGGGNDSSAAASISAGTAVAADTGSRPLQQEQQNTKTLESLAQQHLLRLHLNSQMVCVFVFNTLTRLQIAELLVASWPILPILPAVAEAAAAAADMHKDHNHHHQQQQHQHQQQQQQQPGATSSSRLGQLLNVAIHQHQQQRTASLRQQQMQWLREQQQLLQQVVAAAAASGEQHMRGLCQW